MPTMLIVAGIAAFSVTVPWLTLTSVLALYLGTFPFSFQSYQRFKSTEIPHNIAED
jgi:hypothetical protein